MSETIPEYNARCKAWGGDDPDYRALQVGTAWPPPPLAGQTDMGAKWAAFVDDTYRDWQAAHIGNVPPPIDPTYSGSNSPPPPPPTRKKN